MTTQDKYLETCLDLYYSLAAQNADGYVWCDSLCNKEKKMLFYIFQSGSAFAVSLIETINTTEIFTQEGNLYKLIEHPILALMRSSGFYSGPRQFKDILKSKSKITQSQLFRSQRFIFLTKNDMVNIASDIGFAL